MGEAFFKRLCGTPKYGIDNVRGGSYVQINLDKSTIKELERTTLMTNNKCYRCGKDGHFAKDCYVKLAEELNTQNTTKQNNTKQNNIPIQNTTTQNNIPIKSTTTQNTTIQNTTKQNNIPIKSVKNKKNINIGIVKENVCYRCGRDGHYANNCYAK